MDDRSLPVGTACPPCESAPVLQQEISSAAQTVRQGQAPDACNPAQSKASLPGTTTPVGTVCPPCESAPVLQQEAPSAAQTVRQGQAPDACGPAQSKASLPGTTTPRYLAPAQTEPRMQPVDLAFAGVFFIVGWLFWEMQLWSASRWFDNAYLGTAVFTAVYAGAVLGYVFLAGLRPARESWFWLAVLLCLGFSYALPYGGWLLGVAHYAALLFTAAYWTLAVTGRLLKDGKTSNWLAFDALNAMIVVPFGNFGRLFAALAASCGALARRMRARRGAPGRGRRLAGFAGGAVLAVVCLGIVLPLLTAADRGFAALLDGMLTRINAWVGNWDATLLEYIVKLLFAAPTALYLYGLAYGSVRGRRTAVYDKQDVCAVQRGVRFAPRSTVVTALAVLCAVYLLFILMQAKYLFSAFWGALPDGFSYSEYARQGFFELCRVAAVNIAILLGANTISRAQIPDNRMLRVCNLAVSGLTLLLLATAAAKLGMYIAAYGLTVRRVVAGVFLVWMAAVFTGVIVRQFRPAALVRLAVFLGAVLFALLCALPVQNGVYAYNGARVRAGTLDPDAMEQTARVGLWLD